MAILAIFDKNTTLQLSCMGPMPCRARIQAQHAAGMPKKSTVPARYCEVYLDLNIEAAPEGCLPAKYPPHPYVNQLGQRCNWHLCQLGLLPQLHTGGGSTLCQPGLCQPEVNSPVRQLLNI